jgi:pimeloyl-ACP methyl ester carboxylesterase
MPPADHFQAGDLRSQAIAQSGLLAAEDSSSGARTADTAAARSGHPNSVGKLIVIGFMGGNVSATNLVHREALLIQALQLGYPLNIHAAIFANRDGDAALRTVLQRLDEDGDGRLSDGEKSAARIVIFGHSWGASETVALANRLNRLNIPVLLTVQVDSVQKQSQNDEQIPPNVQEAINFYQSEGLLHGRNLIVAADPKRTTVLGNYESSYRQNPVSCTGYPWYARAFMKRHIQIENDPILWSKIESLILAKLL